MYLSKKKHLLSYAIMFSAVIRLAGSLLEALVRMIINHSVSLFPDMMDEVLSIVQTVCSLLEIVLIAAVFLIAWRKLKRYMGLIEEDDRDELGRLQQEIFGDHLPTLPAETINQLLQIWGVILAGVECIYYVSSMIYKKFTMQLMYLMLNGLDYNSFVSIYNLSHGFKYLEMFTAIVIGVMVTSIILHDHYLKVAAVLITVLFLVSFGIFQMQTIELPGRQIGIVWTSVIYHLTETIGLFLMAVYLAKKYRGL